MKNQKRYRYTRYRKKTRSKMRFEKKFAIQVLCALVIFLICFGISKNNKDFLDSAKSYISKTLNTSVDFDYTSKTIIETFKKIKEKMPRINTKIDTVEENFDDGAVPVNGEAESDDGIVQSNSAKIGIEAQAKSAKIQQIPNPAVVEFRNPVEGVVTSPFGDRIHPISNEETTHMGTDIAKNEGSTVISAASGQVVETGYNDISGNYIIIRHNSKYKTKYAHLSKINVTDGEIVDNYTKIGEVGSTGLTTGAHLHLEMYENDSPIDPEIYLSF